MIATYRAIRRAIRDDRGENSLMYILAQNVALLLMVPMMGAMTLLLLGSLQITEDVNAQSSIKIAGDQFSSDFSSADRIVPLSPTSAAALSSRYTLTGERMASTEKLADAQRQCRISVWEIAGGKVSNVIVWGNNSHPGGLRFASCDTATVAQIKSWAAAAKSDATNAQAASVSYPVTAGAETATLSFYNAAHNELKVNSSGTITIPSATDPSGWYRVDEWTSNRVAEVRLQGKSNMEISGEKGYVFSGKTNQLLTPERTCDPTDPLTKDDPACKGPENPTNEHWVPDPPTNVVVQRCTTSNGGAIDPTDAGFYECAEVSFDAPPISQCGVYPMKFKVYALNDRRNGAQPMELSVGGTSSPIRINNIWNGNTYTIAVTAYCDGSGDEESDRAKVAFTQSLPQPRVSIEFPNPGVESTQRVSWLAPTSDPSVTYSTRVQSYENATPRANWTEVMAPRSDKNNGRVYVMPNPTWSGNWIQKSAFAAGEERTFTGRVIRQGFPIYYGVKARVPSPSKDFLESDYGLGSIIYSLTPSETPTAIITPSGPDTITITPSTTAVCPANTQIQYAFQGNAGRNSSGLAGMVDEWHTGWLSAPSHTRPNFDGDLDVVRVIVNCFTEFVPAPDIKTMLGQSQFVQNRTNDAKDTGNTGDSNRINRASEQLWQFNSREPDRMNPTLVSPWQGFVRTIRMSPAMAQPTRTDIKKDSSRGNWISQPCIVGTIQHRVVNTTVNRTGGLSNVWMDWTNTTNTETESHPQTATPGGSRFIWHVEQRCHVILPAFELPDKNHSNPDGTRDAAGGINKDQYSAPRLSPSQTFYTLVPAPPLAIWPDNGFPREHTPYNILVSGGVCETGNTWVQVINESGPKTAQGDTIFNGIEPKWVNDFLYSGYCKFDGNGANNPSTSTNPEPVTPAEAVANPTEVTTQTEVQDDDILEPKHRPEITMTRNGSGQVVGTVTNMANICQADATPWIGWQNHSGISAPRNATSVAHVAPGSIAWVQYQTAADATQTFAGGATPGQVLVIRASVRCVVDGINTPTMATIMGTGKYNQDDENSITASADSVVINADIKPSWKHKSVTQSGALGTDARNWLDSRVQPIKTSIWKGHYRPLAAPSAASNLSSDRSGKRIYTAWGAGSCGASDGFADRQYVAQIHTINTSGNVGLNYYGWGGGGYAELDTTGNPGGSRFVWNVHTRCHVQLPPYGITSRTVNAGGDANGNGYVRDQYSSTAVSGSNTVYTHVSAANPGISGPGTVNEGAAYRINTNGGYCENGNAWAFTSNPAGGYTAPRDWVWPSAPGPRGYTVAGYCYMPAASNGGAQQNSGTTSAGTTVSFRNVDPQPVPSAPSGLAAVGGAWVACDASSGGATVKWNASSGASYYSVTASWPNSNGQTVSATFTTTSTQTGYTASGVDASFWMTFRVTAVGPGGSSSPSNIQVSRKPGCTTV